MTSTQLSPAAAGKRLSPGRVNLLGLGFLIALVLVWQLCDAVGLISLQFLPPPSEILDAAIELIGMGKLQSTVLHTAVAAVSGWLIGAAIGIVLGLLLGFSTAMWKWSMASFEFLRAIPGVTLAPLSVLLFGFSLEMELALIIVVSTWDVLIAVSEATRSIPRERLELAGSLRLSRLQSIAKIAMPSIADVTIVALKISLAVAIGIAIVAEMIGNPAGIGFEMTNEQGALNAGRTFAYMLSASVLGLVLCGGFSWLTRIVFPGITAASERNMRK